MIAEYHLKRSVHKMRSRVVLADILAPYAIHIGCHLLGRDFLAVHKFSHVDMTGTVLDSLSHPNLEIFA